MFNTGIWTIAAALLTALVVRPAGAEPTRKWGQFEEEAAQVHMAMDFEQGASFKGGLSVESALGPSVNGERKYRPVVFWHGLGDSCCSPRSLQYVADVLVDGLREHEESVSHIEDGMTEGEHHLHAGGLPSKKYGRRFLNDAGAFEQDSVWAQIEKVANNKEDNGNEESIFSDEKELGGEPAGWASAVNLSPRGGVSVGVRGSGDNFNNAESSASLAGKAQSSINLPRVQSEDSVLHDSELVYIYSVNSGTSESEDRKSGFFGNIWNEIEQACKTLKEIPAIVDSKEGINFIGFSQGGVFIRALIATCPDLKPHNVITFGTPNAGVSRFPGCSGDLKYNIQCRLAHGLLLKGVYLPYVQNTVIPAQYYRKYPLEDYYTKSKFLPYLDGEVETSDTEDFKHNMLQINKFAMIMFTNDTMIDPKESSFFAIASEDGELIKMEERDWYKNDTMGFKTLNERGALDFYNQEGDHMNIDMDYFQTTIVPKYFL